jgi:hypothetical protein
MYIPRPNAVLRLLTLLFGFILFAWLSVEDNQTGPVVLLGVGLASLLTLWSILNRLGAQTIEARYVLFGGVLIGALTGLGASLSVTLLMFFKNAWHAHVFLDYPGPMLLAMLERAPYWTLAGALAGLGLAVLWVVFRSPNR